MSGEPLGHGGFFGLGAPPIDIEAERRAFQAQLAAADAGDAHALADDGSDESEIDDDQMFGAIGQVFDDDDDDDDNNGGHRPPAAAAPLDRACAACHAADFARHSRAVQRFSSCCSSTAVRRA